MKIFLAIHHELDPNAGAPGSVMQLGRAYQKLGHTVELYGFDHLPSWVPKMANGVLFPELCAAHLAKMCTKQQYDVVDISTGDAWVWGALLKKRSQQWPLLVTHSHGLEHISHLELLEEARLGRLHLSWKYPLYHGGYRLWEVANSLRCSDIVFMLNRRDADYAIETLHVPSERVHVVGNGIPDTFLNLPFDPGDAYATEIAIAQVGTYIPRKGIHYSAPALNKILIKYPQVKVSLLGTGLSAKHVYSDFDPVIRDRIRIVPRYAHDELPSLLSGHQIILFPSLSEGFPLALPEAMACGLAPISTNIPGPTEIVINSKNGILIPTRDSEAIVHSVENLIQNRPYLEILRQEAYGTAQSYSWAHIAQQRLAIYKEVLEPTYMSRQAKPARS